MAITPTLLTKGHFPVGGSTSVNSASVTPVAGKAHIASLITTSSSADTTHSLSGCSLTWTRKATIQTSLAGGTGRISVFEGTGTPSSGALTFSWTGTAQDSAFWSAEDYSEQPTIRNTATNAGASSLSIVATLPTLFSPDSLCVGFCYAQTTFITDGSGFTNLYNDDFSGAGQQDSEYKFNDTTVDWTFSALDDSLAIALELAPVVTQYVGMIPIL